MLVGVLQDLGGLGSCHMIKRADPRPYVHKWVVVQSKTHPAHSGHTLCSCSPAVYSLHHRNSLPQYQGHCHQQSESLGHFEDWEGLDTQPLVGQIIVVWITTSLVNTFCSLLLTYAYWVISSPFSIVQAYPHKQPLNHEARVTVVDSLGKHPLPSRKDLPIGRVHQNRTEHLCTWSSVKLM